MIRAADLFCGAGGTSSGLRLAARELGLDVRLVAVNHWPVAIQTHTANHPDAIHLCADLDAIAPRAVVPEGKLDVLIASPECTHHSNARGGKPVEDQKRASAWHVLRWAEALSPDTILVENVREFRDWGPIGSNGRPLKRRKGETYRAFLTALESLGYRVADRILNAADFGDPTTRERLFVQARRGRRPIRWPEPTHARTTDLWGRKRWRAAREVIDWTIPGTSIFSRRKPLAPATMRRIVAGLERFGGPELEPFLVILRGTGTARSIDAPVPALTAGGGHVALAEPFVVQVTHGARVRSLDDPLPTITCANRGEFSLVEPFLLSQASGGAPRLVSEPSPTIPTKGAHQLVEAFLVPFYGEAERQTPRTHAVDQPLPTIPASGGGKFGVVEPFLTPYYGTGTAVPVTDPMPTVTAKDRFALVQPVVNGRALDIRFRMLQPHELARAMGFPDDYAFSGNRGDRVKQIGNAVPVGLAHALCRAVLEDRASVRPAHEEVA